MESMELAASLSDQPCASRGPHPRESKATTLLLGCSLEGEILVLDVTSEAFRAGLSYSMGLRVGLTWLQLLPPPLPTS